MEMGFEEFQLGIPFPEATERLVPVYRKASEVLTAAWKYHPIMCDIRLIYW